MRVKLASDVIHRHQDGESVLYRPFYLVVALAKFGLDKCQTELPV